MNKDVKYMVKIYETKKYDWMGYEIGKNCKLTRHHIFKRVYGGEDKISNYALLTEVSHEYLHNLEKTNHEEYLMLNELFQELNNSFMPPNEDYYQKVEKVLKRVKK